MKINTRTLTICALAMAINIALGILSTAVKLPFYLDTIGTVFVAILFGPWLGAAVGGMSNIISSLLTNPVAIPFLIVNVVIGLVVGFIARKHEWTFKTALITGIILGIVAPLIGTPIGVWVYGGLTGTVSDIAFLWLVNSGSSIFASSFVLKVFNNLLDKIPTCLLCYALIKAMPKTLKIKQNVAKSIK